MKNKKLVIALSIFSSVLLIAVVSLVAVLAAFQAQATGGFNITYTAVNVKAKIYAWHRNGQETGTAFGDLDPSNKCIEFNGTEQTENNGHKKSFNTVDVLFKYGTNVVNGVTTRVKNPYYVKFQIENTDETAGNAIKFTGTASALPTNLVIEYITSGSDVNFDTISKDDSKWTKLTSSNLNIVYAKNINNNAKMFVIIRMYPENFNLEVASTTINFDFTLTVA